jgi:hypothetical protein
MEDESKELIKAKGIQSVNRDTVHQKNRKKKIKIGFAILITVVIILAIVLPLTLIKKGNDDENF